MTGAAGRYRFDAALWEHHGQGSWHFVDVPADTADDIEARYGHAAGGFGSVRVEVTVGATTWATSLFPDAKRRTYVLPVRKQVRTAERLAAGDTARITLRVLLDG